MAKAPREVEDRVARGRARMRERAAENNECLRMVNNDQYVFRTTNNQVVASPTLVGSGGRPAHRARTTRNLLVGMVQTEVSAATSRVPGYEVVPSTTDPEDVAAARLAGRVAAYGYDRWGLRAVTERVVAFAVTTDAGFAWPYWDSTVGDRLTDDGLHTGEVAVRVLGPNQVFWEPGVVFEEARWCGVDVAKPVDEVTAEFPGVRVSADAQTDRSQQSGQEKMALVTEYLERPSMRFARGRWLTLVGGEVVREADYPLSWDEPALHRLSYVTVPDSDRDAGLVKYCLDAQRTFNDCVNKQIEWKNMALNPQVVIRNGQLLQPLTDEPGAVVNMWGDADPQWRPVPAIPPELTQMKEDARRDIRDIAAQNDIPPQVEAGRAIQALIERDATRRQAFTARLAEFHSRLMRHCLLLVQSHYTERRLLRVRGRTGWENIRDFLGSQLRGQVDVVVLPGSLEYRTRQAVEQRVMNFAQLGWISPQAAMAAINGGHAEWMVEDYELDVARQNLEIQMMREGEIPPDAREFDNHQVHVQVLESWMKTPDYAAQDETIQAAAENHRQQHKLLLAQEREQEQQAQAAQAEQLGMQNAARDQAGKPSPSLPALQ